MALLLTRPMLTALRTAAARPSGNVCPTVGLRAAAHTALLAALWRRGLIWQDGSIIRINARGRAVVAKHPARCEAA